MAVYIGEQTVRRFVFSGSLSAGGDRAASRGPAGLAAVARERARKKASDRRVAPAPSSAFHEVDARRVGERGPEPLLRRRRRRPTLPR